MIVIEVRLPRLRPRLKITSRGFSNSLIWQSSFGWRSNRTNLFYRWRVTTIFFRVKIKLFPIFLQVKIKPFPIFLWVKIKPLKIFLRVKIKPFPIFLWMKIKPLQIFLLVKSNQTQSSYRWRLNFFNKWIVVYNNGSLKSSSIQYVHTNSVSRIWSIWLKKYFEEIYFQSMILNDLKI